MATPINRIAAYLPYKPNCLCSEFEADEIEIFAIDINHEYERVGLHLYDEGGGRVKVWAHEDDVTLILTKAADMTDEVAREVFSRNAGTPAVDYLLEQKIDAFSLIEQGLAVDRKFHPSKNLCF